MILETSQTYCAPCNVISAVTFISSQGKCNTVLLTYYLIFPLVLQKPQCFPDPCFVVFIFISYTLYSPNLTTCHNFLKLRIEKKWPQSECDSEIKLSIELKHFPELFPKFPFFFFFGLMLTFKKVSNNSNDNTAFYFIFLREIRRNLLFCIYRYYMLIFNLIEPSFRGL